MIIRESGFWTIPKDTLNPKFFNENNEMHDELRVEIIDTYNSLYSGYYYNPLSYSSLFVIGSAISYHWDPEETDEDLDIQVVVNFENFVESNPDYALRDWESIRREMYQISKSEDFDGSFILPGVPQQYFFRSESNITEFLATARLNGQGVYNIISNSWPSEPIKLERSFDPAKSFSEWVGIAEQWEDKLEDVVNNYTQNPGDSTWNAANSLYEKLRMMRHKGFAKGGGHWSRGNFIWQWVNTYGRLNELKQIVGAYGT